MLRWCVELSEDVSVGQQCAVLKLIRMMPLVDVFGRISESRCCSVRDDSKSDLAVARELRGKFQAFLCVASPCKRVGSETAATK